MKLSNETVITITSKGNAELLKDKRDLSMTGDDEIAGHTLYSLVSSGTELNHNFLGEKFPNKPGYASIFKVEETGEDVKGISIGDLVLCTGPHASYQKQSVDNVAKLPEGLDPIRGLFARLMCISMTTLSTTSSRPPGKVMVVGLGPVGHLAAQLFNACGYDVHCCDTDKSRCAQIIENGIPAGKVYSSMPIDKHPGEFNLVLECAGHEQAVLDGCRLLRKGGELVLIGLIWKQRTSISAFEILDLIFHNYIKIRSGWEWELPLNTSDFNDSSIWGNIKGGLNWLHEGRIKVDNLYKIYRPKKAQEVYSSILDRGCESLVQIFDWSRV